MDNMIAVERNVYKAMIEQSAVALFPLEWEFTVTFGPNFVLPGGLATGSLDLKLKHGGTTLTHRCKIRDMQTDPDYIGFIMGELKKEMDRAIDG
jgi:hypothetical protein